MSGSIKGNGCGDTPSQAGRTPDDEADLEAYQELMGEEDEIDVFFILPALAQSPEVCEDPGVTVLRVAGLPEEGTAWVH